VLVTSIIVANSFIIFTSDEDNKPELKKGNIVEIIENSLDY
jgi:hypothetical protein